MKKHYIVLLVLLVIFLLVGCSNSTEDSSGTTDDEQITINETGFPIVNEKINIQMVGQKNPVQANWEDMSIIQEYEEMTNIHIDWETPSGDGYEEKFNLLLASGDLSRGFFRREYKHC
ncbi:hypothetical protein [Gracilibacillus phocaeensis]|uniref:hypothetical protein n=1 Tax=Gracilibacillus phocaeensis TaxID=2042304 RepID=UPI0010326650|nr:hypothetical protein [Gracilibacillus phocaeensis]